jgi:hypothetical protein
MGRSFGAGRRGFREGLWEWEALHRVAVADLVCNYVACIANWKRTIQVLFFHFPLSTLPRQGSVEHGCRDELQLHHYLVVHSNRVASPRNHLCSLVSKLVVAANIDHRVSVMYVVVTAHRIYVPHKWINGVVLVISSRG